MEKYCAYSVIYGYNHKNLCYFPEKNGLPFLVFYRIALLKCFARSLKLYLTKGLCIETNSKLFQISNKDHFAKLLTAFARVFNTYLLQVFSSEFCQFFENGSFHNIFWRLLLLKSSENL